MKSISPAFAESKIIAPVYNYYGSPYVILRENGCFLGMEDWDKPMERRISNKFYEAWKKEFEKETQ